MKLRLACVVAGFLSLVLSLPLLTVAQTSAQTASALPRLVRFGGTAKDLNTNPLTGVVGVTFALYSEQTGGAPLWLETQNVTADGTGHYVALLGATRPEGLPTELFTSEQARWVGVQVSGQAEQPRVLLVSAPYALKAGDAETIGGLLPSAFVLAAPPTRRAATESAVTAQVTSGLTPNVAGTGTTHFIPLWTNSTGTLGNSALFQSGTGSTAGIGIDTTTPAHKLEVDSGNALVRGPQNFKAAGATAYLYVGDTSHPIEAIWGSGLAIGAYQVPQAIFIQDKTGNVGIGTTTPTSGILTTVATSASVVGLSATGWTQPFTAGVGPVNGGDAIHATGGNWYSPISFCCSGGAGLVATGGIGEGMGPGVVANGASGPGTGGLGIDATGGSGDAYGGSGGSFIAGDGRYGGGEGIDAAAEGVSTSDAAFFTSNGGDCDFNCAGYFSGDINVTGAIYAGTKDFRIDHPLDPENKYLQHASVESSEMKNVYDGLVILDGTGEAVVQLPAWFEAVNGDFRYQLTAVGRPSPGLYIAQEISSNSFQIAGGTAGAKVSWQVTGVRHDPYAKAHPLVIEQQKNALERGNYIHPELYGAPEERSIAWARHPVFMKRVKDANAKHAARRAAMETSAPRAAHTEAR